MITTTQLLISFVRIFTFLWQILPKNKIFNRFKFMPKPETTTIYYDNNIGTNDETHITALQNKKDNDEKGVPSDHIFRSPEMTKQN